MSTLFSIIVPVYKGANFLKETIESVLNQTYPHFELILVNDASPDNSAEVIKAYTDPRIHYLEHQTNKGSDAARLTGLNASSGELIIFLDQDDFFHPEKLQIHANHFERHPETGVTYNARFDYDDKLKAIWGIWSPPETLTLADMVLGFPFGPSERVMRRNWVLLKDIWEDSFVTQGDEVIVNGGEMVIYSRLHFAGCKFANVGASLNYRRHHPDRILSDLDKRCRSELKCQEIVLSDPRCPQEVVALKNIAFMNTYLIWAYFAFLQKETGLGANYLREAARLKPAIIEGNPCELARFIAYYGTTNSSQDPEELTRRFFTHLPQELNVMSPQLNWAIGMEYLYRGSQHTIWGRDEAGRESFKQAKNYHAVVDEEFIRKVVNDILDYEAAFGTVAAQTVANKLSPQLEMVGGTGNAHKFTALLSVNRAFKSYRENNFKQVLALVMKAVTNDPAYLKNWGVWSMLARSLMKAKS